MLSIIKKDSGLCSMVAIPTHRPSWSEPLSPLDYLLQTCEVVLPAIDFYGDINHPRSYSTGTTLSQERGLRPSCDWSNSQLERHSRWAQYVQNTQALLTDWDFDDDRPNENFEKPIRHYNLYGTLYGDAAQANLYRHGISTDYEMATGQHSTLQLYEEPLSVAELGYVVSEGTTGVPEVTPCVPTSLPLSMLGNLHENVVALQEQVASGEWDDPDPWNNWIVPGHYTSIRERCFLALGDQYYPDIWIHVVHREWDHPVEGHVQYLTALRKYYYLNRSMANIPLDTQSAVSATTTVVCYAEWKQLFYGSLSASIDAWSVYGAEFLASNLTCPPLTFYNEGYNIVNCYLGFAHDPASADPDALLGKQSNGVFVDSHNKSFAGFNASVDRIVSDCYSLSFHSSRDGIDEFLGTMESNHLEALAEAGSVFGLVDTVRLIKLAKKTKQLKRLGMFLTLLDVLTDAKLIYSFAIAPSMSDAIDVSERSNAFIRKWIHGEVFAVNTIYGKASFDIPDELAGNYPGMHLTVRSKVRLGVEPDSFLSAVLPVRSLGILPSLSNLWDIVPFSFMIDWFTHVGSLVDDIETSAMFTAFKVCTSLHSVRVDYPFEQETLDAYHMQTTEGEDAVGAGYRYYDRFVLNTLPSFSPSRISPYGAGGVPDWTLFGSLLYKFIK